MIRKCDPASTFYKFTQTVEMKSKYDCSRNYFCLLVHFSLQNQVFCVLKVDWFWGKWKGHGSG